MPTCSKRGFGDVMHILETSYDYPPNCLWGTGAHVGFLAESLSLKGYKVTVVTRNRSRISKIDSGDVPGVPRVIRCTSEFDEDNLVYKVRPVDSFASIDGILAFCDIMAEYVMLNCHKPDIIHNHTWMTYALAQQLSEHWNVPIISTVHFVSSQYVEAGLQHTQNQTHGWYGMRAIEEAWLSHSEKIVVPSQMASEYVTAAYPLVANKIRVIEHPNPDGLIKESYVAHSPFRILTVGRLVAEKGYQALMQALKILGSDNIVWIAVGDGKQRPELMLEASRCAVNVKWAGKLSSDEVSKAYCDADVIVVPSITETYGLVVREAMQSGLPVIASKIPTFEDQITDRVTGILIPLTEWRGNPLMDPVLLANALRELIADQGIRQTLGTNARRASGEKNDVNRYIRQVLDSSGDGQKV